MQISTFSGKRNGSRGSGRIALRNFYCTPCGELNIRLCLNIDYILHICAKIFNEQLIEQSSPTRSGRSSCERTTQISVTGQFLTLAPIPTMQVPHGPSLQHHLCCPKVAPEHSHCNPAATQCCGISYHPVKLHSLIGSSPVSGTPASPQGKPFLPSMPGHTLVMNDHCWTITVWISASMAYQQNRLWTKLMLSLCYEIRL